MRIVSGSSKGKKILDPKDLSTRPLKDLTKESIFNILAHSNKFNVRLENSNILDLFSGVGSFGLECLSRGSSSVTFIENYINVLPVLKRKRPDLPVIVMSAQNTVMTAIRASEAGAYEYLPKPFDLKEVLKEFDAPTFRKLKKPEKIEVVEKLDYLLENECLWKALIIHLSILSIFHRLELCDVVEKQCIFVSVVFLLLL